MTMPSPSKTTTTTKPKTGNSHYAGIEKSGRGALRRREKRRAERAARFATAAAPGSVPPPVGESSASASSSAMPCPRPARESPAAAPREEEVHLVVGSAPILGSMAPILSPRRLSAREPVEGLLAEHRASNSDWTRAASPVASNAPSSSAQVPSASAPGPAAVPVRTAPPSEIFVAAWHSGRLGASAGSEPAKKQI
ncbi:hypothetical protein LTR62_004621 [Meristemomyces frigidus]|uniref:Uncharacterized protein n=1 Tax=Meristemomyces frigidus TaxID=1508187 RepID=A0AAN7YG14_9PEZI|nr:hypothetical protein LTR62_004621 [Meristemomyces frigidus]